MKKLLVLLCLFCIGVPAFSQDFYVHRIQKEISDDCIKTLEPGLPIINVLACVESASQDPFKYRTGWSQMVKVSSGNYMCGAVGAKPWGNVLTKTEEIQTMQQVKWSIAQMFQPILTRMRQDPVASKVVINKEYVRQMLYCSP